MQRPFYSPRSCGYELPNVHHFAGTAIGPVHGPDLRRGGRPRRHDPRPALPGRAPGRRSARGDPARGGEAVRPAGRGGRPDDPAGTVDGTARIRGGGGAVPRYLIASRYVVDPRGLAWWLLLALA